MEVCRTIMSCRYVLAFGKKQAGKEPRQYVHRLVWESHFGPIPPGYIIHHIDGNPTNNDIGNLQACEVAWHSSKHNRGQRYFGRVRRALRGITCACGQPAWIGHRCKECYATKHGKAVERLAERK
jgi:hypothetical protein